MEQGGSTPPAGMGGDLRQNTMNGESETVTKDGEEITVYDHVSVSQHHYVNSVNGYETFEPDIAKGDMVVGPTPEAVTPRVADLLWTEFGVDVEDHEIDVINPDEH